MMLEFVLAAILMSAAAPKSEVPETVAIKSMACDFFTNDNATKLLGRKVIGVDSGVSETTETRSWKCTFSVAEDAANGPKIYFMLMKSTSPEAATKEFDTIRQSNKKSPGFEEWPAVADEAVVHSDGDHFKFVMVRKGVKTFRVKISPANGISLDVVKEIAASLAAKL